MIQNALIESIKAVGKRIQKRCPSELKLSHARTGVARALRFKDWHNLVTSLASGGTTRFRAQLSNCGQTADDTDFHAAVSRFSESTSLDWNLAHGLCAELLLPAIQKWKRPSVNDDALVRDERDVEDQGALAELGDKPHKEIEVRPLLAASTSEGHVRLLVQGSAVPVVVRRRRHFVQPIDRPTGSNTSDPTQG